MLWACRRGMLELDLLLAPYAKRHYIELNSEKQAIFDALLAEEDQSLFEWFMGKKSPPAEYSTLIQEILTDAAQ